MVGKVASPILGLKEELVGMIVRLSATWPAGRAGDEEGLVRLVGGGAGDASVACQGDAGRARGRGGGGSGVCGGKQRSSLAGRAVSWAGGRVCVGGSVVVDYRWLKCT